MSQNAAALSSSVAASRSSTLSTWDRLYAPVRSNSFGAAWYRRGSNLLPCNHIARVFVQDDIAAGVARGLVLVAVMLHFGGLGSLGKIESV